MPVYRNSAAQLLWKDVLMRFQEFKSFNTERTKHHIIVFDGIAKSRMLHDFIAVIKDEGKSQSSDPEILSYLEVNSKLQLSINIIRSALKFTFRIRMYVHQMICLTP